MEYKVRLKYKYKEEVVKKLSAKYKSVMQVPKLVKICLNQGIGSSSSDKKQIEAAQNEMSLIAGQKAVLTKSKKDISNFKLRKGMPVGVMVTLRGDKMYEFLDRLITSALPRVRDFNGISRSGFDGRGNYTLGIKEQIAFPEISIDKINKVTGMDITFVTDTDLDKDALDLLIELGLPFKKDEIQPKVEEKLVVDNKVVDEAPVEEVADEEASDDEASDDKAPIEEVADEEASDDEASDDEAPIEEVSDEESLDKKNIEDKKE